MYSCHILTPSELQVLISTGTPVTCLLNVHISCKSYLDTLTQICYHGQSLDHVSTLYCYAYWQIRTLCREPLASFQSQKVCFSSETSSLHLLIDPRGRYLMSRCMNKWMDEQTEHQGVHQGEQQGESLNRG